MKDAREALQHTPMARYSRVTGTIVGLRDHLTRLIETGVDPETEIRAWDGDSEEMEFVTGLLVKPETGEAIVCTDD